MTKYTYYLPVQSVRLSQYLGSAIIAPARYSAQTNDDQSIYPDYLLLSKECGTSNNSNCCLEVVLSESENETIIELKSPGDLFLYNKPLPISRISKVYFKDENQLKHTISGLFSTAFIPDHLVDITSFNSIKIPIKTVSPNLYDWTDKLRQFDKLMGGFALMKLNENRYHQYSDHYFSTLCHYIPIIADELKQQNQSLESHCIDLLQGQGRYKMFAPYLKTEIDENKLKEISFIDGNQKIQYKGIAIPYINIDSLNGFTYIASILYEYGVGNEVRRDKIDSLILSGFKKGIKTDMAEIVALAYGMNRGYTIFPNKYKFNEKVVNIKLLLDSKLDYFTIESLYQNTINRGNVAQNFNYLDWCPSRNNDNKDKPCFKILDTNIFANVSSAISPINQDISLLFSSLPFEWKSNFEQLIIKIKSITNKENELLQLIKDKDCKIDLLNKEITQLKKPKKINISSQNSCKPILKNNEKTHLIKEVINLYEMKPDELDIIAKKYGYKDKKGHRKRDKIMYILESLSPNLNFDK